MRRPYGKAKGHIFRDHQSRTSVERDPQALMMKKLTWRQSVVAVAFLLSLSVAVFFVVRAVRPLIYWHYHQDEPIRGRMNVGYVVHSYNVPPHCVHLVLGFR